MPTLKLHLAATPVHDLRGIANRLGVSRRSLRRKSEFIDAIVNAWADATTRRSAFAALSPAARGALSHLLRVNRTPAALFFAEYGAIRHARTQEGGTSPWRNPSSVTEELYYVALLGAVDLKPLRTTAYLCTPSDLELIDDQSIAPPMTPHAQAGAASDIGAPAWACAYDVAQWLIMLHEQAVAGVTLFSTSRTVWPPVRTLQQLNRRLAIPEPEPLPRAPSQMNRLRLILFLADAAGLQCDGAVTPLGWAWLDEPPEQQTALLWRTWLDASPLIRQRYAFADGLIPRPWPAPLLNALKALSHGATASRLAEQMLDQEEIPAQYWVNQVDSLGALHRLVARVVNQICIPFGLAVLQRYNRGVGYHLTPLGDFLLGVDAPHSALWQSPQSTTPQIIGEGDGWSIALPPAPPFRPQADLAAYATHVGTTGAAPDIVQHYKIDSASLARAASAGFRWPGLAAALERATIPLDSQAWRRLAADFAQIPTVELRTQTLLHAAHKEDLRSILQMPALRPLIDNLLSATTATLTMAPDEVRRRLQAAGYAVLSEETPIPEKRPDPAAALWLAARLYLRLADFLSLPLPLFPSQLDELLSSLPPIQRSTLSAFFDRLESALLDLLDGRLFASPPFVGDVEAHRLRLETAVAQNQPIYIDYFSPSRNLLTRRPIEPLWIEQIGDRDYVRAECLLSGRVLLFRLDRMRAIWDTPPEEPVSDQ